MKRQFAGLSKAEQENVEAEYHSMKGEDFDETMAGTRTHRVHEKSLNRREDGDNELAHMAAYPDIQRELREIDELWEETPSSDFSS